MSFWTPPLSGPIQLKKTLSTLAFPTHAMIYPAHIYQSVSWNSRGGSGLIRADLSRKDSHPPSSGVSAAPWRNHV